MGHTISIDDNNLFDKLRELCIVNKCGAERISGKWVAFVQNKKLEMKVTIENLDLMERESHRGRSKPNKTVLKPSTIRFIMSTHCRTLKMVKRQMIYLELILRQTARVRTRDSTPQICLRTSVLLILVEALLLHFLQLVSHLPVQHLPRSIAVVRTVMRLLLSLDRHRRLSGNLVDPCRVPLSIMIPRQYSLIDSSICSTRWLIKHMY